MRLPHNWSAASFSHYAKVRFSQNEAQILFEWCLIIWAATWENRIFAYAKTKTQISFAVTAKLISAFVFATWIVQSLYFLNSKFRASRYPLWLHSLVCVGPGRKPRRPVFWRRGSYKDTVWSKRFFIPTITQNCLCNMHRFLKTVKWLLRMFFLL